MPSIAPTSRGMIVCEWVMPNGTELILDITAGDEPIDFLLVEQDYYGNENEIEAQIGDEWPLNGVISLLLSG